MIARTFNPWRTLPEPVGFVFGPLGMLSCTLLIAVAPGPSAQAAFGIHRLRPPDWTRRSPSVPTPVSAPTAILSAPRDGHWYRILPGATLWGIEQRTGVPVDMLERANHLANSEIYAGSPLWIPRRITAPPGTTWGHLARILGVDESALAALNPGPLTPGRVLWVPPKARAPGADPVTSGPAAPLEPATRAAGRGSAQNPAADAAVTAPLPASQPPSAAVHLDSADLLLLAHLVQAEAGDQPFPGQVAVAAVVLNRLKTPGFPKTVTGIIDEPGQFQSVANGTIRLPPSPSAMAAASMAARGVDPTDGALYYYNPALTQNQWIRAQPVSVRIADQVFAR